MQYTDLLARDLEQAMAMCRSAGWDVDVEYIAPPGRDPSGSYRVVRCRKLAENRILLTVAREMPGKEV